MIETGKAVDIVLNDISKLGAERISVFEALGRIVAAPVIARRNLPAKDMSAMDGYAVISSDTEEAPVKLKVKGVIPAGLIDDTLNVEKGTCYRIMTGAFVPNGANAVIEHERTDNAMDIVTVNTVVKKGNNIRYKGEDMETGSVINRVGDRVTPYHIARYISAGIFFISVYRKPKIAIVSTGSEIADPSEQDSPLKTFDSNGPLIKSMLQEYGADVSYMGVVPDKEDELLSMFSSLKGFDIIVTSAGISVGDFDLMNIISDKLGISWKFNAVNQKPGKHMSFGYMGDTAIFACPGNPVSAMFCAYFYVKPAVLKMSGANNYQNVSIISRLGENVFRKKGRVEFSRVKLVVENGVITAYPFTSQDSHRIESIVAGNAFARFDDTMVGELPAGTEIETFVFNPQQVFG